MACSQKICRTKGVCPALIPLNGKQIRDSSKFCSMFWVMDWERTTHCFAEEAVADDTANSNTSITSRVSPRTWRNLLPQRTRRRLMIRHAAWILTRYHVIRADTGTLFLLGKIVMEQHHSTPSPSQSWSKETKSSGFTKPVNDSITDQNSKPTVNPGRRSTAMELANDSTFSGEQTTIATSSVPRKSTRAQMMTECKPTNG